MARALRRRGGVGARLRVPRARRAGARRLRAARQRRRPAARDLGRFTLVRACPSATWPRGLPAARWAEADVAYDGDAWSGGRLAEVEAASAGAAADADADGGAVDWTLANDRAGVRLALDLGANGQIGVFPEQWKNWDWLRRECARRDGDSPPRVLNLFSYTGGSTLACAAGGAAVTHLDGARSAVSRARRNARLAGSATRRCAGLPTTRSRSWSARCAAARCTTASSPTRPPLGAAAARRSGGSTSRCPSCSRCPALLADPPAFVLLSCHDQKWPRERSRRRSPTRCPRRAAAAMGERRDDAARGRAAGRSADGVLCEVVGVQVARASANPAACIASRSTYFTF